MEKLDFFQSVCRQLDEIPLTEVLKQKGIAVWDEHATNAKALCPFHADKTVGSFVVTNQKKMYKCFACEAGGRSVLKLVAELEKERCTFQEAVMETALAFDLITTLEWESYFEQPLKEDLVQSVRQQYYQRTITSTILRAKPEQLDRIYRVFRTVYQKESAPHAPIPILSPSHYEQLQQIRGLSDAEIINGGYFTMPSRRAFFDFALALMEAGVIPQSQVKDADFSCLLGVPGFYQFRDSKRWTFTSPSGIGIPIRNVHGQIVGIQVRHDEIKEGQKRYRWFTSSHCNDQHPTFQSGVGPGTPIDVFYPQAPASETLYITEGRFKAQALAKAFHSIALSVQGIQSWRAIEHEIVPLGEHYPIPTQVYVAFDADLVYNPHVFRAAHDMIEFLIQRFPMLKFGYLCWDEQWGKGIDDVLLANQQDQLIFFEWECFKTRYLTYQNAICHQFGLDTLKDWSDLSEDHLRNWFNSCVLLPPL